MATKNDTLKKLVEQYDPRQVGMSVAMLREQIVDIAKTFGTIRGLSRTWKNVVVCGMGGSALGADVLRWLYQDQLTVPIEIINDYHLPGYANASTLVIIVSYSGSTEEPLACLDQARQKRCGIFAICAGGALATQVKQRKISHYIFATDKNPSGQPRIGTGYTMTAIYLTWKQLQVLRPGAEDLVAAVKHMQCDVGEAMRIAKEIASQSCIIVAAEHLKGNAHVLSNQLNETAKKFAPYFVVPELNHHLMEGLASLQTAKRHWTALFIDSSTYSPVVRKRMRITAEVFAKQGFKVRTISVHGSRAAECLQMLSLGSWISYYAGLVQGIDPSKIQWVDYFKKRM